MSINFTDKKILVTGHKGLVGSSFVKYLKKIGYQKIFIADRKKYDLLNQSKVNKLFTKQKFDAVIIR